MGEKLHGTQTRAATDPLVLEKKKLHDTQTRFFDVPMNFQLGRVIAGFSNKHSAWLRWPYGLEGNRIAGFSNLLRRRKRRPRDWKGNRIAGCSNDAAI